MNAITRCGRRIGGPNPRRPHWFGTWNFRLGLRSDFVDSSANNASSERCDFCKPRMELTVVLLEGCNPHPRQSQLLLEPSMYGPIFFRFRGVLAACGKERSDDRGEVHLGQDTRYREALAAFGRARAVEGLDRRKCDAL